MREISSLLHIQEVIDALKAVDLTTLTEPEREAVEDCLQQAYDRAAFLLHMKADKTINVMWYYPCQTRQKCLLADAACTSHLRSKG